MDALSNQRLDRMVVELAPEKMLVLEPVKTCWRGNVLHLKVKPGFDESTVLAFCWNAVMEMCTGKRPKLSLKFVRNPLEYDKNRNYDTKFDTGDYSFLQYLMVGENEYRVGSIDFVAPLTSRANTTVIADIVPPSGELETPSKAWFKLSGAAQERIYIAKAEFPKDPTTFELVYWKHVYNKEGGVYEYINGKGERRLKNC